MQYDLEQTGLWFIGLENNQIKWYNILRNRTSRGGVYNAYNRTLS